MNRIVSLNNIKKTYASVEGCGMVYQGVETEVQRAKCKQWMTPQT